MTSQENSNGKMDELKAEAKGLGIKSPHFFKTEEALQAKIDVAKAELAKETVEEPVVQEQKVVTEPKRKKAPKMQVTNLGRDGRTELIARLEREDPECKYAFDKGSVTDDELAAKGFERTTYSLGNDIVIRTDKEAFTEYHSVKRQAQTDLMKAIDTEGKSIGSVTETQKKGT